MRVAIVSPTALAAQALRMAVTGRPGCEVAWVAVSATAAVDACATLTPDLLVLDLRLDGIDGVDVTRRIMSKSPCPILLVTDSLRVSAADVFDAVGLGALDAVEMPAIDQSSRFWSDAPLLAKINTIANLIAPRARGRAPLGRPPTGGVLAAETLVAVGASAGGPGAISAVLASLPDHLPAAVVIVQHVSEQFLPGMVRWLDEQSRGRVTLAQQGQRPVRGQVSMAGAGGHLTLTEDGRFAYTAEPVRCAYRPSVDVFFESVSRCWTGDAIGVLLTGMGRDGALGLKALRDRGHYTIAQDEATSAVYGMPKAASALGAAVDILPLDGIAGRLLQKLHEQSARAALQR